MVVLHWVTVGGENLLARQVVEAVEVAFEILAWTLFSVLQVVKVASPYCVNAAMVVCDYLDSTG